MIHNKEAQYIKAGDVMLYERVPIFSLQGTMNVVVDAKPYRNKVIQVGEVYNGQINIEYLSATGENVLRAFPYRQVLEVEV